MGSQNLHGDRLRSLDSGECKFKMNRSTIFRNKSQVFWNLNAEMKKGKKKTNLDSVLRETVRTLAMMIEDWLKYKKLVFPQIG